MTRKNVARKKILDGTALVAITNSDTFRFDFQDNIGIQAIWSAGSGTPLGDFEVDASIDGVTFSPITPPGSPTQADDSGNVIFSLNQLPYRQIRVRWARSQGQIDLEIWAMSKPI